MTESRPGRSDPHAILDGGGNIDVDALYRAYEARDTDEAPIEASFQLKRDLAKRLDQYLANRIPFLSRTSLQRLISERAVTVNGHHPKASTTLHQGDVVRVVLPPPPSTDIPPENIPLKILYEDDQLVVINKDSDIIVHPARGNLSGTIVNAMSWHFQHAGDGQLSSVGAEHARPGIVHRLDRHTTGTMVIAKTDTAHWRLGKQFQDRTTDKRYLALVHGTVEPRGDIVELPLGKHPVDREKYAVRWDDRAKESTTIYRVREQYDGFALLEIELKTGRTHQIRVHLAHLGWPIAGDDVYGGRHLLVRDIVPVGTPCDLDRSQPVLQRQALHAAMLSFEHPQTGKGLSYLAPMHQDMAALVHLLREHRMRGAYRPSGAVLDLDSFIAT
ncbi:MAG: RluA family pseudouridine synthase [Phycisphaerales bacterium]|jgi:23S rRNA pseudouridine1911/1915/1917 synthase|nr:RluA family pseudouridine synthase [Phycisphaerales bacterium]